MKRLGVFFVTLWGELYIILTYPLVLLTNHPHVYRSPHPKGTIVIVACWFTPNIHHKIWSYYLERKGYRTYVLNLPMMFESFDTTIERLEKFVLEHKLKRYTLVGISTGALVCLYFLKRYKKWNEVHKFISMGGPLHGTWVALFISFTKKGRDMLPWSRFIQMITNKPIPLGKMVTLSAAYDELVPKESSVMKRNTSYVIPVLGHNKMQMVKYTYDLIAHIASSQAY